MAKAKRNPGKAKDATETADQTAPSSLPFEAALEELEQTVARLEGGEMPLEEALELFETGVKLSRQCNETLEAAERRIEILVADRPGKDGTWATEEFESALEEESDFENGSETFEG